MKKKVAILLVICVVFSMTGVAFGANASDIKNHWGKEAIQSWMNRGLIGGYSDGTFRPDKAITRAEFMVMVNKAFNLEARGDINFTDVAETDWFYDTVRAAFHANYISGYSDGGVKPNHPISRQEAAVILSRITEAPQSPDAAGQFSDSNLIAGWAKGFVGAVVSEGYMTGYPLGTFKPSNNITRAEAVSVLNKILTVQTSDREVIYREAGVFGPITGKATIPNDVIVRADGITLQNIVIKGDLIISEEVGNGDVILNNVTVEGEAFIRGGGKDSIHMNGGEYNKIIVQKTSSGHVRIVATNLEGIKIIISEDASGEEIILEGNFDRVVIEADRINVTTQGKTSVEELTVSEGVKNAFVRLSGHSVVSKLVADASVALQGQGAIKVATGKKVGSCTFEKAPELIILPSSGGSSKIEVEAVSVTGEAIIGTVLTAAVSPAAATVNFQWKISPDDDTYVNIDGAASSTYIPGDDDVGKFIKAAAWGTGKYKGTVISDAAGPVIPAPAQTATASASEAAPVTGVVHPVTLTVKDSLGKTDITFNGARAVTISGVEPSLLGSYGSFNGTTLNASSKTGQTMNVTFTNGVASPGLSLNKAAAQTIAFHIAGVAIPKTNSISIVPVVADTVTEGRIAVTDPGLQPSGSLFNLRITLYDKYGNTLKNGPHKVTVASDLDDVLVSEEPVTFGSSGGTGAVSISLSEGATHTLTVAVNSEKFASGMPGTVKIPAWNDASGWFILGDASGGGGGGGGTFMNGARGGNGGGNDDTIAGTDGNDIIFGDGSGGGGGYQGRAGKSSGAPGAGGGGNDEIYGGLGNDIIFGDGFHGLSGWNYNRGGFGGGGGGGGGHFLADNVGGQGGLGGGSGRGHSGNGIPLVSGFGSVGQSAVTATSKIGYGGSSPEGYGGGGGFGGSNGGSGGNYDSDSAPGQDGNTDPHAYKFSDSTIYDYTCGRLGDILGHYANYGAGSDVIDGGPGSDHLFGLGGNDIFEFRLDGSYGAEDTDTIWDFNIKGRDCIRLISEGAEITPEMYALIIEAQIPDGKDRKIVFSNGSGKQLTIIVKNLDRDLTADDFGL